MRKLHVSSVAVVALSMFIGPSPAGAATIPASAGAADNSGQMSCFQRDWGSPGRVSYTCSTPPSAWWDIPLPVTSTGNKTIKVYVNHTVGFTGECDAFVLGGNGTISRWSSQSIGVYTGWVTFTAQAVNADESAEVSCNTWTTAGGSTDYISAVGGF